VRCSLAVQPGDRVRLGQTLFTDLRRPELRFTSPASGIVAEVERAEMRRMVAVVIEVDGDDAVSFPAFGAQSLANLDRQTVTAQLLESGDWVALRTRPFGRIANPGTTPGAIFVRAMDTNPLAADAGVVLRERGDDLDLGLTTLSRLCDGPVFVCTAPDAGLAVPDRERLHLVAFDGPHPAGLVGTHIHQLFPVTDARPVWYAGYQDVLAIGHLFRTGRLDPERVVSLAGPLVRRPRLLRTCVGASTEDLVRDELEPGDCRILSGSILSGRRAAAPGSFLGRYHEQICALPAREDPRASAWLVPGRLGARRAPPWRRLPGWGGALHGRPQAMLPLDTFERVVPMRIPVALLLRSLAAGDADAARAFGALELEEEDLALCSFLCPSKLDYGSLLREALRDIEEQLA
jgi:Na+-transporting NADH:ubiquinone oxidoreductase subunit A